MLLKQTYIPKGFVTLLLTGAAQSLSAAGAIPSGATSAIITIENFNARWRDDGVAPTSTVGMIFLANNTLEITNLAVLNTIQFIQADTGAGTLSISYYAR